MLDYFKPKTKKQRTTPILSALLGIVSGPVGYKLAIIFSMSRSPEETRINLMMLSICGVLGLAFLFAFCARLFIAKSSQDIALCMFGIITPILWSVAIVIYVMYGMSQ